MLALGSRHRCWFQNLTYLMGLPHHGFPPTHMPSWNPLMSCRVAYIPHWRGEARWQYFRWLKRGKEFLNKRLQNKLFTFECVLPCALSLEGVGVEENKCVGHGWYHLKLQLNIDGRFMHWAIPVAVSVGNPWPSLRVRVWWGFNYLYPDPYLPHPYPCTPGVWQTLDHH